MAWNIRGLPRSTRIPSVGQIMSRCGLVVMAFKPRWKSGQMAFQTLHPVRGVAP